MYKFIPKVDLRSCEFLNFRNAVLSQPCPHCHNTGALKAHGSIRSSHPDRSSPDARRAVRFYCSNRHGRTGCGRTFSIHFDHIIPRCSLDTLRVTTLIESFCTLGATGITDAQCARRTVSRWVERFLLHLGQLRSLASLIVPPDFDSTSHTAHAATIDHLKSAFPETRCLATAYQSAFQASFCTVAAPRSPNCHWLVQTFKALFSVATRNDASSAEFVLRRLLPQNPVGFFLTCG